MEFGNEATFSELLSQASQGDRVAQEAICEKYERRVRIVARVLLGPQLRPHLDTTDVLQSVHRSLLVGLRGQKFDISSPEKLVALACTMVRRKVAKKWRSHCREENLKSGSSVSDFLFNTLNSIPNKEQEPSAVAQYRDSVAQLYKSLNSMERCMLERRLEGYTTGEVAAELGMHPVAIRVRWSRLRQRLENAGVYADWV